MYIMYIDDTARVDSRMKGWNTCETICAWSEITCAHLWQKDLEKLAEIEDT